MKVYAKVLLALLLPGSTAFAKPVITAGGVVNAASYATSGLPNSGIAQGSIFIVFGTDLAGRDLVQANTYPLPTALDATSIKVTIGGSAVDAIMVYTLSGQVAAILPSATPVGDGTLTLTYNGEASNPAPIHVVKSNFGIFTQNSGGTGPAIVTDVNYKVIRLGSTSETAYTSPAKPGDTVILWGTGLGPVTGNEAGAPLPGDITPHPDVYVGGKKAAVSYSGRSGCCSGLDQIVFVVPAQISGCYVPVAVRTNGIISNFTSMSVSATGETCSDPIGAPAEVIQKVTSGQNVNLGLILLSRLSSQFTGLPLVGDLTIKQDSGSGFFYKYDPRSFLSSRGITSLTAFGSCTVFQCQGNSCIPDTQAQPVTRLDAGAALSVTGPLGAKPLPKIADQTGAYTASLGGGIPNFPGSTPDYLEPGDYTISGPGGTDVGAFQARLTIANPVTWTKANRDAISTIDRSQDLTIQWTGGADTGYVAVFGTSTTNTPVNPADPPQVTGTFACVEKAGAGQLTVPGYVLSALPASGALSQAGFSVSNGFLLVGDYPQLNTFSATGLDLGIATSLNLDGKNVNYQ
jgi:uncharacterized protein (TIGR03437 family)